MILSSQGGNGGGAVPRTDDPLVPAFSDPSNLQQLIGVSA